ncbi:hypothetical protein BGZ80_001064 [Entomortierella chlamydospora]|uniref:Major facilitator superfamily (MFS) profile domain-containing protein n=1 Tax=Entomortierella chlamydospora TaxID=101097 RepID=A0A9P6MSD2_9FUNG|nr:hypothetical protein BGZ80_001064 [Entomortierella chlamydospora]
MDVDEPTAAETTALLAPSSDSPGPKSDLHPSPWYWPWQASHRAAIPVILLAGLSIGPARALTAPLIKALFCERGIPMYFPIQNNTNHLSSLSSLSLLSDPLDNNDQCDSAEYSAAIAEFIGINASLTSILVALTVRFWSALGDRLGRKRVMLVWAIGTVIAQIMPLLIYYNKSMSIYFIWVGSMIEGVAGASLSLIALTHAYAADVTRPEERTVAFGQTIAGWYAGLGIGSALGGAIVNEFGLIAAFWLMPVLVVIDIIYITLIPESLTVAAQTNDRSAKTMMTSSQSQSTTISVESSDNLDTSSASGSKESHPHCVEVFIKSLMPEQLPNRLGGEYSVVLLMVTCFLVLVAVIGASYQISPYLLYQFHWPSAKLSYVGAIQGLSRLAALTLLLPFIKRRAPRATISDPASSISFDLRVVVMGTLIEALTMLLYGVTSIGEGFYLGGMTGAVGSLFFPAIRGILSQSVASELLGKTLGTLATFESVASAISPSLFAWIYGITLETHPPAVFYIATVPTLLASALAAYVLVIHKREMRHRAWNC